MNYHVYRIDQNGVPRKLGETRYIEDAKAILTRWAEGYIAAATGEMLVEKGLQL